MPHTVWDLGSLVASVRVQPRQFVAGIEPAQEVVIGRSRARKRMLVIHDAWLEVNDFGVATADLHQGKYSLALGKDPLNAALLLPIGRVSMENDGADHGIGSVNAEQLFKAQGTMWAAKEIAIDFQEQGVIAVCDMDLHLDWGVALVDWWTWIVAWNRLEAHPDGSLVDGERAYA